MFVYLYSYPAIRSIKTRLIFLVKSSLFTVFCCLLLCLFVCLVYFGHTSVSASLAQWLEHWSCKPGVESSGREKALASVGHVSILHPEILGAINWPGLHNRKLQNQDCGETVCAIRLGSAFNRCNFPSFCLKPLQVKCFEYLLKGKDIVAVLPTGFGKSLLLQVVPTVPDFLAVKADNNIVKNGLTSLHHFYGSWH